MYAINNITFLILLMSVLQVKLLNTDHPVINTRLGKVRGFILTSRLGNPIYSFTSIRYAKAPVGDLRFQVGLYLFKIYSL